MRTRKLTNPLPSTKPRERRGKLVPISPGMQHWSAMLRGELETWPGVSTKSMFGLLTFYRGKTIFAGLPGTRAFRSGTTIIFKFKLIPPALLAKAENDSRVDSRTRIPGRGWLWFELNSEADLRDALWWLNKAYEAARR